MTVEGLGLTAPNRIPCRDPSRISSKCLRSLGFEKLQYTDATDIQGSWLGVQDYPALILRNIHKGGWQILEVQRSVLRLQAEVCKGTRVKG